MTKPIRRFAAFALLLLALSPGGYAQQSSQEKPKPATTTTEARPVTESANEAPPEVSLSRALLALSLQIDALTKEVRKMRQESERNSAMLELLLYEERLLRLEDKIDEAVVYKAQLDAREQDILRRQRNIQQELAMRGGAALRRDEAEAALRQEFQRALEEIRSQQSIYQTRISEMQAQADRLRFRIETLRQKVERLEAKPDGGRQQ